MHSSTTFDRIVELYHEAGALLAKDDLWTASERARYDAISLEIDQLWPRRRAELVRQVAGPPQFLGGGNEYDQKRAVAHGIAPLPSGGD